jgi:uncharacterized membrane protein
VTALLRTVHLLALGIWVGSVVFFSFFTAPTLFGALPRDLAGRAVSAIFPRYYALGAVCGAVAILAGLILGARQPAFGRLLAYELVLLGLMTGIVVYAGAVVLPQAAQARQALPALEGTPGYDDAKTRFDALHRRSVALNGTVLLLGIASIALYSLQKPNP